MSIGSFDDILGPDDDEEDTFEEWVELTEEDLEELFEETINESLNRIRKNNKKVWIPEREMNV